MLITLSRRTTICQSFAEVQLTCVAPLGAVSHRFNFLIIRHCDGLDVTVNKNSDGINEITDISPLLSSFCVQTPTQGSPEVQEVLLGGGLLSGDAQKIPRWAREDCSSALCDPTNFDIKFNPGKHIPALGRADRK